MSDGRDLAVRVARTDGRLRALGRAEMSAAMIMYSWVVVPTTTWIE
jgi:hypothetical protein